MLINPLHLKSDFTRDENGTTFFGESEDASSKKKMLLRQNSSLEKIKWYTPPQLHTGKCWFIDFYAFDPAHNEMRRKRIKLNFVNKPSERRAYANELIKRLNANLMQGWNPWIESENSRAYHTFDEVCGVYRSYVERLSADKAIREETYAGYVSYLSLLCKYNQERKEPIKYIYQFDNWYCTQFLDYVYIEKKRTAQTRDNYLAWLRIFSTFLVEKHYLKTKPTEGLAVLGKRLRNKKRTIIGHEDMPRLKTFLEQQNKHFLLACYLLYYCFIRPKELGKIQIKHISLKNSTILIPASSSKNKSDGVPTMPHEVVELMLELGVLQVNTDFYLFSDKFRPGKEWRDEKQFRDYWAKVKKALGFPAEYQFYSLKDSGITDMLRKVDPLSVRDQARHHDLSMTNRYTPTDNKAANAAIVNYSGKL